MSKEEVKKAVIKFVLFHRDSGTEIEMPILSICEEYSAISFSASEDDYCGIGRLPTYPGNDTADKYDVFVDINGERHQYAGEFYKA